VKIKKLISAEKYIHILTCIIVLIKMITTLIVYLIRIKKMKTLKSAFYYLKIYKKNNYYNIIDFNIYFKININIFMLIYNL